MDAKVKKSKAHKPESLSLYEFLQQFPDEAAAVDFFEKRRWGTEPYCPHCGSLSVSKVPSGIPMPYRCRDCRKHFSVRTGTVLAESKIPLHKWLMAIYMSHISRKGVSSVQMAKELGVTQKTAWFLNHRIREAMQHRGGLFSGEVEVDEVYIGGKRRISTLQGEATLDAEPLESYPCSDSINETGKLERSPSTAQTLSSCNPL